MKQSFPSFESHQSIFPVADFTGAHITSRELVAALVRAVSSVDSREVVLDFRDVQTISRAAAHQLFSEMKGKEAHRFGRLCIANANEDVNNMLSLISRSVADKKRRNDLPIEIGLPVVALAGVALLALLSGKSS
jgi:hypothetical protein